MTDVADMIATRAANDSIRGYCYQFDRTILEILNADEDAEILVEGLEDIDVLTATQDTAVQVKYWSSKKYSTPRSIHEPVELMLDAFSKGAQYRFILHVHFGQESDPPNRLTIDELRQCLTRKTRKTEKEDAKTHLDYEKYSIAILEGFVEKLHIQVGEDFESQNKKVKKELASHLGAQEQDISDLYYATALAHVQSLAMTPKAEARKVTRKVFLTRINTRPALYSRWHAEIMGADRYATGLARHLKKLKSLSPTKAKALIISLGQGYGHAEALAYRLATEEYGAGKMRTAKPWTLVLDGNDDQIKQLKKSLIQREVKINDGYESICFQPKLFSLLPVITRVNGGDLVKDASYTIRISSLTSFRKFIEESNQLDVIIAPTGLDDELCRSGSADPPVLYQGLSVEHIHKIIGSSR
ncbi:hypothetical protein [Kocuria marina]|uniref:hypothetical protein n=1 Tax=Kocuria marina TaxID=223184 RepID=UPI0022DF6013|nr:hypothetical protein [Kocuria marina]